MKRKILAAALAAALLLALLWGCAAAEEQTGLALWFAGNTTDWNNKTTAVVSTPYRGESADVESLLAALLSGPPDDRGMYSPIPEGTRLLGWRLEGGSLWVDLSYHYGHLTGFDLTLADYTIALTLCQLPEVEQVAITANGSASGYRRYQLLAPDQVIFSGAEEEPVEVTAALYFPRAVGRGLGFETRTFLLTEDESLPERVARALVAGPDSRTLSAAVPDGTALLGIRLEDGVCYIDLSETFVSDMPENGEAQANVIYSIINTLGNLDGVDAVCILAEGQILEQYGYVVLTGPLEPDFSLGRDD